jgi:sialate O-acetylesterase
MASGQSNMQFTFRMLDRLNEAAAQPANGMLRLFNTPRAVSAEVKDDAGGQWELCRPEMLSDFSAVAYYFGKKLQADRQVPVGIIVSAWGGTKIETWMPMEDLKSFLELREGLEQYELMVRDPFAKAKLSAQQAAWQQLSYQDPGNRGFLYGYADPDADLSGWKAVAVPGTVEQILGEAKDGAFWFRRAVQIPDAWAGRPLTLQLGVVDDLDQTYVNGIPVGSTGTETTGFWMTPRSYPVPAYAVGGNELTVAVRVFDMASQGGFLSAPADLKIFPAGQEQESVQLAGSWQFKAEYIFNDDDPLRNQFNRRWGVPDTPRGPANLYNAMIAPFIRFPLRGAIWYQGESNADDPELYSRLFPNMIESWRRKWNQPEMAFVYVELAAFMAAQTQPSEGGWAWQREAQQAALTLPNTAVATAIDVGNATNIHPKDKQTVGSRLALAAGDVVYGDSGLCRSPQYKRSVVKDGQVVLSFEQAGGGLVLHEGSAPKSFAICGADQVWHWAQARLDGEQIVVWSPEVPEPVAVRYAWANNPQINVFNRAGLPLLPFRTDQFPMK